MKRTRAAILCFLLVAAPMAVQAQFTYTTNANAITITGYTGTGGDVIIPTTIDELPVTSIGANAFYLNSSLTSVTIPGSVSNIGDYAFAYCSGLTNATMEEGVTSVGTFMFSYCGSLSNVTIPGSVTNIGNEAFISCTALASLTMPDSVMGFGYSAFAHCTGLTSVTIPESITSITAGAFTGCFSLTNVTIPDSVTNIGDGAFDSCGELASITIPDGVTSISQETFQSCTSLTNVILPEGITSIGEGAFHYCTNLITMTIPDSVTNIGDNAFYNCASLTHVAMPGSLTTLGTGAFASCTSLPNIVVSGGISTLGEGEFWSCSSLVSVTIPGSVLNIGSGAFLFCGNLSNFSIPAGLTNIGDHAFYDCVSLPSVTIPGSVASIGDEAFYSCTGLTNITIGAGVLSLGAGSFMECMSLANVTIPASVAIIRDGAFAQCTNLTNVTMGNGVTNIGDTAFISTALTTLTIPASVSGIGNQSFADCAGLTRVYFESNAPTAYSSSFAGDVHGTAYYLPGTTGWEFFPALASVLVAVPAISTQPSSQKKPLGGVANFSVQGTGALLSYVWLFDGDPLSDGGNISGSVTNELAINSIMPNDAGSYSVVISNVAGVVTSKVAQLTLSVEKTKPSVTILSPKANSRSPAPLVSGTASDAVRVQAVTYWITNVNNGVTILSGHATLTVGKGSSNWIVQAALLPGTNILVVQSSNYSGLTSPVERTAFFYQTPVPFQLVSAGMGTITGFSSIKGDPAPSNMASLYVGENYTLTANPASNWLFANWMTNGVVAGTNTTLAFIMESNLTVTANFVTNFFVAAAARYDGIFYLSDSQGATEESSGLIENLQLKSNGVYSGKLYLSGTVRALAGSFNRSGQATEPLGQIPAAGGNVTLQLSILSQQGPPRQIIGSVQGATWISSNLNLFAATTNTNNFPSYTVLLPQDPNDPGSPPSYGYALITNTGSMVNMSFFLADGSSFSRSEPINEEDRVPVYANLYGKPGLVLGTMSLAAGIFGDVPAGGLTWIKPPQKTGLYTNGFNTGLGVEGSPWTNSASALAGLFPHDAQLTLSGGGLSADLVFTVQLTSSNTLSLISGPANFSGGHFNRANGQMTLTFTNSSGKKVTGTGAFL